MVTLKPPRTPPPGASPAAAAKGAIRRIYRDVGDFVGRVWQKAGSDDIFFLAGGIAFNFLLAAVPFLLLLIAIFGYFLQANIADPVEVAGRYIDSLFPSPELRENARALVGEVIQQRNQFGILGILLLIWVSTRVIGSLRSALRSIFDIPENRGIVAGKIFDAKMVVVAGTLFLANTSITIILEAVQTYGIELLGISASDEIQLFQKFFAQMLAYAFILAMFVLIYRYLPARRIPWRIAGVAAIFTAVAFELLKSIFAWYVANIADYRNPYGAFGTVVVLIFWVYYSAVVFVVGGEVGQVYELHRIRRKQRELLE